LIWEAGALRSIALRNRMWIDRQGDTYMAYQHS